MRRLCLLALLISVSASACASDPTGPGADITGAYSLRSVNGNLPHVPPGTDGVFLTAGMLTLRADSTFTSSLTYDARDGVTTQTDIGRYRRIEGDRIEFIDDGHVFAVGKLGRNSVTVASVNEEYIYRK